MTADEKQDWRDRIPLYLTGRLSEAEEEALKEALTTDPDLKKELSEWKQVSAAYDGLDKATGAPSPSVHDRILEHIRTQPRAGSRTVPGTISGGVVEWFRGLVASPRAAWGVAGAQLSLLLLLLFMWPSQKSYDTLTDDPSFHRDAVSLHVVFRPEAREAEIRALLTRAGARIADGPDPVGLYILTIEGDREPARVLEILEASGIVRFAERPG